MISRQRRGETIASIGFDADLEALDLKIFAQQGAEIDIVVDNQDLVGADLGGHVLIVCHKLCRRHFEFPQIVHRRHGSAAALGRAVGEAGPLRKLLGVVQGRASEPGDSIACRYCREDLFARQAKIQSIPDLVRPSINSVAIFKYNKRKLLRSRLVCLSM
jgi:hypothetical protein